MIAPFISRRRGSSTAPTAAATSAGAHTSRDGYQLIASSRLAGSLRARSSHAWVRHEPGQNATARMQNFPHSVAQTFVRSAERRVGKWGFSSVDLGGSSINKK